MKEQQPTPAERRKEFWSLPPEGFADRDTVGAALFVERVTMEKLAISGAGPAFTRVSRRALYRKSDVLDWIAKTGRKGTSTAELSAEVR